MINCLIKFPVRHGSIILRAYHYDVNSSASPAASDGPSHGSFEHESIVIVDLGSQTAMLIARRVRELNVYCELVPPTASWERVRQLNPRGVILSGGPASVHDDGAPTAPDWALDGRMPVLGICYGMQTMANQLGGHVESGREREFGAAHIYPRNESRLLDDLPRPMPVWMSHGDRVDRMPDGFRTLAGTDSIPIAAMGDDDRRYGIQFHPEVVHTPHGLHLLSNFVYEICRCSGDWDAAHFITETVEEIREQVGGNHVICGLSGGVDSSVAAALVHRAVGDQLTCIYVDNGLMRLGETEQVVDTFDRNMHMNLRVARSGDRFLEELAGVDDPETKRKRIGETFISVFEETAIEIAKDDHGVDFLVQGTTYPDVVESAGSGHGSATAMIKSHHNVGGLPDDLRFELIEPLRHLFKDEVREVGRELGLPEEIVGRQPYPGPGLAIRIIGPVTHEKVRVLQLADAVVMDEIREAGLYDELWQSFAILTDTRTVGVQGDARTYGWVCALRAVTADDAMTADWARLPYEVLGTIANRIVNEIPEINRVVYDITSKPPGTIEWE